MGGGGGGRVMSAHGCVSIKELYLQETQDLNCNNYSDLCIASHVV